MQAQGEFTAKLQAMKQEGEAQKEEAHARLMEAKESQIRVDNSSDEQLNKMKTNENVEEEAAKKSQEEAAKRVATMKAEEAKEAVKANAAKEEAIKHAEQLRALQAPNGEKPEEQLGRANARVTAALDKVSPQHA